MLYLIWIEGWREARGWSVGVNRGANGGRMGCEWDEKGMKRGRERRGDRAGRGREIKKGVPSRGAGDTEGIVLCVWRLFEPAEDVAFFDHLALLDAGVDEAAGLGDFDVHQGVAGLDDAEDVAFGVFAAGCGGHGGVEVDFP